MKLTIWKYQLHPDNPVVQMPAGARILCAREQNDNVCMWALVDPSARVEPRLFAVYGTGHPIDGPPGQYLGTAHLVGGALVLHVFEQ